MFYWETDLAATSVLQWKPSGASTWNAVPHAGPLTQRHGRTLRELPPGSYDYQLLSVDSGSNQAATPGTFQVVGPPLPRAGVNGTVEGLAWQGSTLFFTGNFLGLGQVVGGGVTVDGTTGNLGLLGSALPEVAGPVYAVVPDGQGGLYIGGGFASVAGLISVRRLAHILSDGGLDPDFRPTVNGDVYALALTGNTLWIGGSFDGVGDAVGIHPRANLAAYDLAANVVLSRTVNTDGPVNALVAAGGGVFAGGSFATIASTSKQGLAKLDLTGGVVQAWSAGLSGSVQVRALAASSTALYAGGIFTVSGRNGVAAFDLATPGGFVGGQTVNDTGLSGVRALALDVGTGRLYVGGNFADIGGSGSTNFTALNASTFQVITPAGSLSDPVTGLGLDGSDVLVGVEAQGQSGNPSARRWAFRVNPTTGTSTAFQPRLNGAPYCFASYGAGLFVGGAFSVVDPPALSTPRTHLGAVSLSTGLLSFAPNLGAQGWSIAPHGTRVLVGGAFLVPRRGLAAFFSDGGVDPSFDAGMDGPVQTMTVWNDRLYVSGPFLNAGGRASRGLAALDARSGQHVGSVDADGDVTEMSVDQDTLYLGGVFTSVGGQGRVNRAALDVRDGGLLPWNPTGFPAPPAGMVANNGLVYVASVGFGNTIRVFTGASSGIGTQLSQLVVLPSDVEALGMAGDLLVLGGTVWPTGNPGTTTGLAFMNTATGFPTGGPGRILPRVWILAPNCALGLVAVGGEVISFDDLAVSGFAVVPVSCTTDGGTDAGATDGGTDAGATDGGTPGGGIPSVVLSSQLARARPGTQVTLVVTMSGQAPANATVRLEATGLSLDEAAQWPWAFSSSVQREVRAVITALPGTKAQVTARVDDANGALLAEHAVSIDVEAPVVTLPCGCGGAGEAAPWPWAAVLVAVLRHARRRCRFTR